MIISYYDISRYMVKLWLNFGFTFFCVLPHNVDAECKVGVIKFDVKVALMSI